MGKLTALLARKKPNFSNLLICRLDNIGDVILTLPLAGILKKYYPDCEVSFLVREYVYDIVKTHPCVDKVIRYEAWQSLEKKTRVETLMQWDAILLANSTPALAEAAFLAKIPLRIGHAGKWHTLWYCNRRCFFSRRRKQWHEAQLNTLYLRALGIKDGYTPETIMPYVQLGQRPSLPAPIRVRLDPARFKLILHPGSNGNGKEWPITYFQALIKSLPPEHIQIILTGSSKEAKRFEEALVAPYPFVYSLMGQLNLESLHALIAQCDGLIAAGTGPLHLAAATGIRTLGLFPTRVGIDAKRWHPIGVRATYQESPHPCIDCSRAPSCVCMEALDVAIVKKHIQVWLNSFQTVAVAN